MIKKFQDGIVIKESWDYYDGDLLGIAQHIDMGFREALFVCCYRGRNADGKLIDILDLYYMEQEELDEVLRIVRLDDTTKWLYWLATHSPEAYTII